MLICFKFNTLYIMSESIQNNVNNNINSGKSSTILRIDAKLLESSMRYMVLKGKAWNDQNQAFVHLVMLFMKNEWYNENHIATKVKDYLYNAPFTVKDIKAYLHNLNRLGVLESKTEKGIIKYKLTKIGIGMIIADEVMNSLFKMYTVNNDETNESPTAKLPSVDDANA